MRRHTSAKTEEHLQGLTSGLFRLMKEGPNTRTAPNNKSCALSRHLMLRGPRALVSLLEHRHHPSESSN